MSSSPEALDSAPVLSVVVPTMNKVDLLQRTLGALLAQEAGPGRIWEVIVVNDGSTDGTADYLARTRGDRLNLMPSLEVVSPERNVGRARARNLGARQARGRYILFLDDDIVAPEGLLRAHLDLLEENPGHGTIGRVVTSPEIIDGALFHYLDSRGVAKLPSGPAPGRFFVTQNATVPRKEFLGVGGFDEGFTGYGFEDMEVAFRLEDLAGVRFLTLPFPVPAHVHHHTLAEYFDKKRECGRQSLGYIADLHPHRIREMQLHHVLDVPESQGPGLKSRLIRSLAASPVGDALPRWLENWPTTLPGRPRWPRIYCSCMSLAVLFCFRQGLTARPLALPKRQ
jgi:glycosyltransferase involved in cell wall biosynthesis